MTEGTTCYKRDEELCKDAICLRDGCRLQKGHAMTDQKEATELELLAETIHKARWPDDRQMAITPFADEDRNGREYCFRIARAIAALRASQSSRIDTATDAALRAVDEELARRAITSADEK